MLANNFTNFLFGGSRGSELRETKQAWKRVDAKWRKSPLAQMKPRDLAIEVVQAALVEASLSPEMPIVIALQEAAEQVLSEEPIQEYAPPWNAIEHDVEAAVAFRETLAQRRLWLCEFKRVYGVAKQTLSEAFADFLYLVPDSIPTEEGNAFQVPLADLMREPARAIERLLAIPYGADALRFDLFKRLRETIELNLRLASGFRPTDDLMERQHKLVMPTAQQGKTAAELARLYLGGTPFESILDLPVSFNIPEAARFEHCHIVGGTGHGKTQLMQHMIYADLKAAQHDKRSVVVIDSQGDLISKLTRLNIFAKGTPNSLADRLVVIDPADVEYPPSLNLFDAHLSRLERYGAADRERVLNGAVELYELIFGSFLGAELTQKQGVIFKYLARLMLAIPNATIHTLMAVMENGSKYKQYMEQLNGSARYFFAKEFFDPSFSATKKQILKRLWGVLSTPAFERMLAQPTNKLDLFEALNDGKIILINTAKDLLKRDGSQVFGRFFIAMLVQAALERSTIPESKRTPAFVYVDEAQEYFDDSIETILNQARKYRVGLTLAHQTLDQLSTRLRSTLLANTSIKCVGGVSAKDADSLHDELHTTSDFLQGMRRGRTRTEFAVWVKHTTPHAIRLTVPLGFLERQPMLADEDYDALLAANRSSYCGIADSLTLPAPTFPQEATAAENLGTPTTERANPTRPASESPLTKQPTTKQHSDLPMPTVGRTDLGKGGSKHRYLQNLVKELAELNGLHATIEAPLASGGQVDVLLERDGPVAAIEISVATPADHERENLKKCLAAGFPRVAMVLAKSKTAFTNYRTALVEIIPDADRERVSFLLPEDLPDFIASLSPPAAQPEKMVKGYRVRTSVSTDDPAEARARREAVGRLVAKSLAQRTD